MSNGVSLRPEDAAKGGFLDGVESVISDIGFVGEYPNGSVATLLRVEYTPTDKNNKPRAELYSVGTKSGARSTPDGKSVTAPMAAKSSAMLWINQALNAGFPASRLSNDITVFKGLKVVTKRTPLPKTGIAEVDDKNKELVVIDKIVALPEENKAAAVASKPKAAAAPKKAAAPAAVAKPATDVPAEAEASDDHAAHLDRLVGTLLATAEGNTIPRNRIGTLLFQHTVKAKLDSVTRSALMKLAAQDEYWHRVRDTFAFDGTNVVGVPAEDVAEAA